MNVEKVLALAEKARKEWADKHFSEAKIAEEVHTRLDRILDTAIYTFLGLEHRWGEFSVDHCNGRRTILSNKIEGIIQQRLPDLLEKHASKFDANLSASALKALKAEYNYVLERKLRTHVMKKAEEDADKLLKSLLEKELNIEQLMVACQAGGEELAREGERE